MYSSSLSARLIPALLALTLAGYPFSAITAISLGLSVEASTYPMRGLIAAISLAIVVFPWFGPRRYKVSSFYAKGLMLFLLLYGVRLFWDFYVADVPGADRATLFFFVTTLPPVLAIWSSRGVSIPESSLSRSAFILCTLTEVLIVSAQYYGWGIDRNLTEAMGGRLGFDTLNPITVGHLAATALICAGHQIIYARENWFKVLAWLTLPMSLVILVAANSRGPVVSLAVVLVILALTRKSFGVVVLVLGGVFAFMVADDYTFIERFLGAGSDGSSYSRYEQQRSAIADFLNSPALGSAFVDKDFLDYPHNIFVEAAMAMGVLGFLLILTLSWRMMRISIARLRDRNYLIACLFLQYFVGFQLSGSMWGTGAFWLCAVCLLTLSPPNEVSARLRNSGGSTFATPLSRVR